MPSLHKGKLNDYSKNPKKIEIFTPEHIAYQIFKILNNKQLNYLNILDICSGKNALTIPFNENYEGIIFSVIDVKNNDIEVFCGNKYRFIKADYLEYKHNDIVDLILCNPPFNSPREEYTDLFGNKQIKSKKSDELYPFKILKKIFKDFPNVPLVFFCPYGLLFNTDRNNPRHKWLKEHENQLSSILVLNRDTFKDFGVLTHSCVTFWNFENLKPIYFVDIKE